MALKSMIVDVVCREPASKWENASAAVLAVSLIYLNWAMNSRCLSRRGERFRVCEEGQK